MDENKKFFGTDGIRGPVGKFPINAEFVLKLGWAVGKVLSLKGGGKVLIGKDTRISGYMFESALQAGLSAAGIDVYLLGPIPTPAIAYLARTLRAQIGIVISASHNLYHDNGIKFFSEEGLKLDDNYECAIEQQLMQPLTTVDPAKLGKVYRVNDARGRYIEFCKSSVPHHTNFKGLDVVIDCAHGATCPVAPQVFSELQANVTTVYNQPNGLNINENCGSLYPESLQATVLKKNADVGIAFDGDGDRVIMVDHKGEIVDGDELLFIIANNRQRKNRFSGGVVGTLMSNMGLEVALQEVGIPFKRTLVGDRYVLHAMIEKKWQLGGESSGHIVCLDITTTGDGIISALQVLEIMRDEEMSLFDLKSKMKKFPQVKLNIPFKGDPRFLKDNKMKEAILAAESRLQGRGRVLVRASGTEPLIRVMVEGENATLIGQLANEIAGLISQDSI